MTPATTMEKGRVRRLVTAWRRPCRWPDGCRISALDDRWATMLLAVCWAAGAAVAAIGGIDGVFGGAGGWPTVAGAVVASVGAWLWARRRLARVCGDGHRPRLPDGRWINSLDDRASTVGYFVSALVAMIAVYAAVYTVAPRPEATASKWMFVPVLVSAAANASLIVRMRAVEVRAVQ